MRGRLSAMIGRLARAPNKKLASVALRAFFLVVLGQAYGLSYAADWMPASYNTTQIPGTALLLSDYANFAAAITACRAQGKALKVDCDMDCGDSDLGQRQVEMYGVPVSGRPPKLTYTGSTLTSATKALMYCYDADIKARYIEFIEFGDVYDVACGGVDRDGDGFLWEDITDAENYGFRRGVPTGEGIYKQASNVFINNGVGVGINQSVWDIGSSTELGNLGPGADIQECLFTDCQQAFFYASNSVKPGKITYLRNIHDGTYGMVDMHVTILGDMDLAGNEWKNCLISNGRELNHNINCHRMHTGFKLGVETYQDVGVAKQTMRIEGNSFHDIEDNRYTDSLNAGVPLDLRNCNPSTITAMTGNNPATYDCSIVVRRNLVIDVVGLKGQEDCNWFYSKSLGHVAEYNWVENMGAVYWDASHDGSESNGELHKTTNNAFIQAGAAIVSRYNVFKDMPPSLNNKGNCHTIKASDLQVKWAVFQCKFINSVYLDSNTTGAVIRRTDDENSSGDWVSVIDGNEFWNADLADRRAVWFHELLTSQSNDTKIMNNKFYWGADADFSVARPMFGTDGGSQSAIARSGNKLHGTTGTFVAQLAGTDPLVGSSDAITIPAQPTTGATTSEAFFVGGAPFYLRN